ncbi:hypothetical protein ABE28_008840 [Peribacillus muralis]|uniref:Antirepressor protein C-terminal domain-containing protein n=1 Tax=Peribacillus muralis TaxID=264697 RepID=A0A1B3XMM1_9BACI|nr:phage antirepressor KilAC domain-containing protein [Peribacillus muralis]AOH54457.1 hypothetical protein ABE28_008840 [Peribacillus muralis]
MNQLVFNENGQAVTDSLTIAEVFGKEHKNILRDIRDLEMKSTSDFFIKNFREDYYISYRNKKYPKFVLTEDGLTFLTLGYNKEKYIEIKENYIKTLKRSISENEIRTNIEKNVEHIKSAEDISIKEYKNQRVVTFKDVDEVHRRPYGTASRNFKQNKKHFIEGKHFYKITRDEIRPEFGFGINAPNGILITEFGYLKLVKSFTDDLSWEVQEKIVEVYFRENQKQLEQIVSLPTNFAEALRLAADLEEENERNRPKVEAHDKFISGENYQKVGQVAKVLNIGRNKLFVFLRENKILMSDNTPYQQYIDRGYFVVKEKPIEMGSQVINKPQTYVTAKGVDYISKLLDKKIA